MKVVTVYFGTLIQKLLSVVTKGREIRRTGQVTDHLTKISIISLQKWQSALAICLSFGLGLNTCGASGATLSEKIEAIVPVGFSGQIVVGTPSKILFSKSYGLAERDPAVSITNETIFDIGSVTKTFTAALVLQLAEQDQLQVDQRLSEWFLDLRPEVGNITLHQLLTHTSGLAQYSGGDREKCTRKCFDRWLRKTKLRFEPGKQYEYSNPGYSVLARIVEIVHADDYESILQQLLLDLNIGPAGYLQLPDHVSYATGYDQGKNVGKPPELGWMKTGPSWHLRGNGGLLMSAETLFHWLQANANQQVVGHAWQAKQFSHHAERSEQVWYGYGWAILDKDWGEEIDHTGGNGIFFADARWLRGFNRLFTITNSEFDRDRIQTIVDDLRKILVDE